VDGIGLTVVLAKTVLAELRAILMAATADSPEVGGILLGHTETGENGTRTFVDAFERFTPENPCDPKYALSGRDRRRIERRRNDLAARRRRGALAPVGLWRSHCRRGLYLDQRDFELFRNLFRRPACVFLLVRHDDPDAARGAVFIWEGDDVRRHASYLEFPLEALPAVLPAAAPPAKLPRVRFPRVRLPRVRVGLSALPAWLRPAAMAAAPPAKLPRMRLPRVRVRLSAPPAWLRTAAMAVAILAVPVAAYYAGRAIALSRFHGAAVANAALVSAAVPPAVLPAPPPEIRPTPFPEAEPSDPPPAVAPPPRVRRPLEVPPRAIDPASAPTPTLPDPPPLALKPSIASPPRIVAAAPAAPAFHNEAVTAYIKPAPHSTLSKAIRKIPLLRGIARPRKEEGFVPASPVAHPLPALPDEEVPAGEPSVELLAHIDRSGSVDHVRFADGNSHLRDASASALSQWRFEPARQNGEPVESELLVRFEFRKEP